MSFWAAMEATVESAPTLVGFAPEGGVAELSSLRQQLAAALERAQQAERRAEFSERTRRDAALVAHTSETQTLQERIQSQLDQLAVTQAELKRALADCARLARERDALRDQLAEARATIARKDEILGDAMVLAAMVKAQ